MKKISVIIPNYNGAGTLGRCLDSVVGQGYQNVEIIIIDDGSTDNSMKIIEAYKKQHKGIKLIELNHSGSNGARKAGVIEATGDYVMFVDADDYLEQGAIELVANKFAEYDVDVIRFNARYISNDNIVVPIRGTREEQTISHDEVLKLLLTTYTFNSLWSQAYKASLVKKAKAFDLDISLGEDLLINAEIHKKTKNVLVLTEALYFYNTSSQSMTHSTKREQVVKNVLDRIYVSDRMINYAAKCNLGEELEQEACFEQLRMLWNIIKRTALIENYDKKQFARDFGDKLEKDSFRKYHSKKIWSFVFKKGLKQAVLSRRAVAALADYDLDKLWKCIQIYGFNKKITSRRQGK